MPKSKADSIQKEEAMKSLDSGESRKDVAERYGVSVGTLVKYLGLGKKRARHENGNGSNGAPHAMPEAPTAFNAKRFTEESARLILTALENRKALTTQTLNEINEAIGSVEELVA